MATKLGVITGKDLAERDGVPSHRAWIERMSRRLQRRNLLDIPFTGRIGGETVLAFISFGRWSARCPDCGSTEYVDPEERIFFCFGCGNRTNGGNARPVAFPPAPLREEIEQLVMARQVGEERGTNAMDRALKARCLAPGFSRSWEPPETPDDLRTQNQIGMDLLRDRSVRGGG